MRLVTTHIVWACLFALGCNQGGAIKGKVTVEGGSAAALPVFVLGPQSVAAVTDAEGNFATPNVVDGAYVVRVTVKGAEVPEQTASTAVTQGKQVGDVALSFKLPSATVQGTVAMSDGSAPTGVVVSLSGGPEARSLAVGMDGAFKFEKLLSGAYTLTAAGSNTLEGQVSQAVSATAGTPSDVGMVKLTPFGRIEGTVTGMGVKNARVSIAGQSFAATPDDMGKFVFERVPGGMHTVVATTATVPVGTASASASVTVSRGMTASAMLALMNDPPRTGIVKGSVTYATSSRNADISVRAQGLAMPTVTPDGAGAFSLTLPVGRWTIEATAPAPFPAKVLGTVDVVEGQTITLPAGLMSLYVPVLETVGGVNDLVVETFTLSHVLYRVQTGAIAGVWTWYVLDRATLASRAIYTGPLASVLRTGQSAKYALLHIDLISTASSIFLYELATGSTSSFGMSDPNRSIDNGFLLSSDDAALFLATTAQGTSPPRIERITLGATPTRVGFDNFVAFGVDRAFYRQTTGTTFSVFAVNVGDAPTNPLFSSATSFSAFPTPWARTACTTMLDCTLAIAAPSANTSNPVPQVRGTPNPVTVNAQYPIFVEGNSNRSYRVDSMSGGAVILPVGTFSWTYAPDNSRFAYVSNSGGMYTLREEPTATATGVVAPVYSGPSPVTFNGYVSNLRHLALVSTATLAQLIDIKAASATGASSPTTIPDVRQPSASTPLEVSIRSAQAAWRTSAGRIGLLVGDSAIATVDALAQPFQFTSVPIESPSFPFGVIRQSGASLIVNMSNGMTSPGPTPGIDLSGVRLRTKAWISSTAGTTYLLTDPMTGRTFPVNEPWLSTPIFRFSGAGNLVATGSRGNHVYFAPHLP